MKGLLGDALILILIRVHECILGLITLGNKLFMAFFTGMSGNYGSGLCSLALLWRSLNRTCGFLCAMTFLPILTPSLSGRSICKFESDCPLYYIFEELLSKIVESRYHFIALLRFS